MPAPSSRPASSARPIAIGAGVVVAALLLGFASYTATKPTDPRGASAGAEVSTDGGAHDGTAKLARRDPKDPLAMGRADAPVVMIEYADFLCGYCGQFARETEPELVDKYVKSGVLRIEWRNFPIFGEESEDAARAAWAAGQQGRFWQFHTAAYAEGAKEKGFGKDQLKALAEEAGVLDLDRFAKDLDSKAARAAVARDEKEAQDLGVASTPSFLINGRPISGAQPLESFGRAIETARETAEWLGDGAKGDTSAETPSR
ncbi:DsbA family protein [Streptomyces sp. NBC_00690]|uniref:DsbA family protein n=1 Tax=Streptomyces sp. NBC_00690 TaxID=2975808 RepID=UPI002E2E5AF3|nr:DsbA family protein [Streptomyces sp. NBC_00690]